MNDNEYRIARMFIILTTAVIFLVWLWMQVTTVASLPSGVPEHGPTIYRPSTSTSTSTSTTPPPPSTTTTTTIPTGDWSCPTVIAQATEVGWPTAELVTLDRVVWRESRCIPTVSNLKGRDRSYGLMQINTKGGLWPDRRALCGLDRPDELLDPAVNLACGLRLFERSGWSPWGTT